MKKILIVCDSFRVGGIQKSLRGLLDNIDYKKYIVYLYLFNDRYPEDLSESIHKLKSNFFLRTISLTRKEAKEMGIFIYLLRIILTGLCRLFGSNLVYSTIFKFTKFNEYFDTAISFSNNGDPKSVYYGYNAFVLKKVKCQKRVTFLHVNYEQMHMDNKYNRKEYFKFDTIACVSLDTRNSFLKFYPELEKKTKVVYNFLPIADLKEKINNPYSSDEFILVSAGRLDNNKNPLAQLEIANDLKRKKYRFKWYLLGDGPEKNKLQEFIIQNQLEKNVFLLGNKNNVYDYLKYANVYISTSKSESYGLSIAESLYLKTPVLALEYPALNELIENDWMICKNQEEMKNKIITLIENEKNYKNLKNNTKFNYDKNKIIKQYESIF